MGEAPQTDIAHLINTLAFVERMPETFFAAETLDHLLSLPWPFEDFSCKTVGSTVA